MPVEVKNEVRAVAELRPDPRNARKHSREQITLIAGSISNFSYVTQIVIRPDGVVIGGHATLEAVKLSGRTEIECRVVYGLTDAQYRALALALNKLPEESAWDDALLADNVREVVDAGIDPMRLGFSNNKELDRLLGNAGSDGGGGDEQPPESKYAEQYGVIVVCPDAVEQEAVYNALTEQGYSCKIVTT